MRAPSQESGLPFGSVFMTLIDSYEPALGS
jgi:hypothetical protein